MLFLHCKPKNKHHPFLSVYFNYINLFITEGNIFFKWGSFFSFFRFFFPRIRTGFLEADFKTNGIDI